MVDTNIVSELRKPAGNPNVKQWIASADSSDLFISALVLGEIRQGIERLRGRDPAQAGIYESWLERLSTAFSAKILPITVQVAQTWGRINVPDPLPVIDGLMAATAITHNLIFVTRNTAEVAKTGVRLLNPFESG